MVRSRQSVEPVENKATEAADMVRTSNRNIGHDRQRESRVTWVPKYRCGHFHSLCTVPSPKGNSHNKQINKKRQKSDQQQMLFPTGVSFPSDVTHHRTHKSGRSRNRNRPTKQKKSRHILSFGPKGGGFNHHHQPHRFGIFFAFVFLSCLRFVFLSPLVLFAVITELVSELLS